LALEGHDQVGKLGDGRSSARKSDLIRAFIATREKEKPHGR